jgi:hypothetical protein
VAKSNDTRGKATGRAEVGKAAEGCSMEAAWRRVGRDRHGKGVLHSRAKEGRMQARRPSSATGEGAAPATRPTLKEGGVRSYGGHRCRRMLCVGCLREAASFLYGEPGEIGTAHQG